MAGFATAILPGQEALFILRPASSDHPIGGTRLSRNVPGKPSNVELSLWKGAKKGVEPLDRADDVWYLVV
jgi:hypothetical protein